MNITYWILNIEYWRMRIFCMVYKAQHWITTNFIKLVNKTNYLFSIKKTSAHVYGYGLKTLTKTLVLIHKFFCFGHHASVFCIYFCQWAILKVFYHYPTPHLSHAVLQQCHVQERKIIITLNIDIFTQFYLVASVWHSEIVSRILWLR